MILYAYVQVEVIEGTGRDHGLTCTMAPGPLEAPAPFSVHSVRQSRSRPVSGTQP